MTPEQRDIVLIPVPFSDLTSTKRRPVLVLSTTSYTPRRKQSLLNQERRNDLLHGLEHLFRRLRDKCGVSDLPILILDMVGKDGSMNGRRGDRHLKRIALDLTGNGAGQHEAGVIVAGGGYNECWSSAALFPACLWTEIKPDDVTLARRIVFLPHHTSSPCGSSSNSPLS